MEQAEKIDLTRISKNFIILRRAAGLTQEEFASQFDEKSSLIERIEQKKSARKDRIYPQIFLKYGIPQEEIENSDFEYITIKTRIENFKSKDLIDLKASTEDLILILLAGQAAAKKSLAKIIEKIENVDPEEAKRRLDLDEHEYLEALKAKKKSDKT